MLLSLCCSASAALPLLVGSMRKTLHFDTYPGSNPGTLRINTQLSYIPRTSVTRPRPPHLAI